MPDTCGGVTFMGCKVKAFDSSVGFGSNSSTVTIQIVEDGTTFMSDGHKKIGEPVTFTYGSFSFRGILDNWEKSTSMQGEEYVVRLRSPNIVLENALLIYKGLSDVTGGDGSYGMPGASVGFGNVVNAYPTLTWCFDYGPVWYQASGCVGGGACGVRTLINAASLNYKGHDYSVNVTAIGNATTNGMTMDGDSSTFMEAIDQIATASAQRIHCHLVGNEITFTVKSRAGTLSSTGAYTVNESIAGLSSGTVTTAINNMNSGSICKKVLSFSRGLESANSVSGAIVNGDFERAVFSAAGIYQYFGMSGGSPIYLQSGAGTSDSAYFVAPVTGAANSIGFGGTMSVSLLNLRAAMHGFDSWFALMCALDPTTVTAALGYNPGSGFNPDEIATFLGDASNANPDRMANSSASRAQYHSDAAAEAGMEKLHALHDAVRGFGSFWGQKFIVRLEATTGCVGGINPEYELSDGGWGGAGYVAGLPGQFHTGDGRQSHWLKFSGGTYTSDAGGSYEYDLSTISDDCHISGGNIFFKLSVDSIEYGAMFGGGAFVTAATYAVCSIGGGIAMRPPDGGSSGSLGNAVMALIVGAAGTTLSAAQLASLSGAAGGGDTKGLGLAPAMHFAPASAGVAVKSNIFSYGPWYAHDDGPGGDGYYSGKTEFRRNTGLNPWSYGSISAMDSAGATEVDAMITGESVLESGSIRYYGTPPGSLADALITGGPDITAVKLNIGMQGEITTVEFRTFVPNTSEVAKDKLEKINRMAQRQQKATALLVERSAERSAARTKAIKGHQGGPGAGDTKDSDRKYNSGYHGNMITGKNSKDSGGKSDGSSTGTGSTSKAAPHIHGDGTSTHFKKVSGAGQDTFYRPVQIGGTNSDMSVMDIEHSFPSPTTSAMPVNASTLNPFMSSSDVPGGGTHSHHDMHLIVGGNSYPTNGLMRAPGTAPLTDQRPLAHRGPVIITGWGYDKHTKPVPNSNSSYDGTPANSNDSFANDFLVKPADWKTGPLDVRWDEDRQVWSAAGDACTGGMPIADIENYKEDTIQLLGHVLSCSEEPVCIRWFDVQGCANETVSSASRGQTSTPAPSPSPSVSPPCEDLAEEFQVAKVEVSIQRPCGDACDYDHEAIFNGIMTYGSATLLESKTSIGDHAAEGVFSPLTGRYGFVPLSELEAMPCYGDGCDSGGWGGVALWRSDGPGVYTTEYDACGEDYGSNDPEIAWFDMGGLACPGVYRGDELANWNEEGQHLTVQCGCWTATWATCLQTGWVDLYGDDPDSAPCYRSQWCDAFTSATVYKAYYAGEIEVVTVPFTHEPAGCHASGSGGCWPRDDAAVSFTFHVRGELGDGNPPFITHDYEPEP